MQTDNTASDSKDSAACADFTVINAEKEEE